MIVLDQVKTVIHYHVHLSSFKFTFLSLQQAELLYNDRNLDGLVVRWFGSTYNGHQMQAMISAAALCVQKSSHCQPKISEVSLSQGKLIFSWKI